MIAQMIQIVTEGRIYPLIYANFARIGICVKPIPWCRGGSGQADMLAVYYNFSPAACIYPGKDPPWRGPIHARSSRAGRVRVITGVDGGVEKVISGAAPR